MKKPLTMAMIAVFLAVATAWAQTPRKHTRPAYSGPRAASSKIAPLPSAHHRPGSKPGSAKKDKASHILVR